MRSSSPVLFFFIVVILSGVSYPQTPIPPGAGGGQQRNAEEAERQRRLAELRTIDQRLRAAEGKPTTATPTLSLTDAERDRIIQLRQVDQTYITRNTPFLRQAHTGVFRIFPDLGCISKDVLKVSKECERFVPLTSSFIFRTNSYGDVTNHDIYLEDNRLSSRSFFSQGIFSVIGDEPIDKIDLTHPAFKYLVDYQPDVDAKSATEHAKQFRAGVDAAGYRYADSVAPQSHMTYAMRMIAYRLENGLKLPNKDTTATELMFHRIMYDERVDVFVVFRILERDKLGGLTILWKELGRNDAAKIRFGMKEPLRDFREYKK